jgi:hypothetical protein
MNPSAPYARVILSKAKNPSAPSVLVVLSKRRISLSAPSLVFNPRKPRGILRPEAQDDIRPFGQSEHREEPLSSLRPCHSDRSEEPLRSFAACHSEHREEPLCSLCACHSERQTLPYPLAPTAAPAAIEPERPHPPKCSGRGLSRASSPVLVLPNRCKAVSAAKL